MKKADKLYRQVCDGIMQRLTAGEFPVGSKLPTERELSEAFEVSRPTVREAMVALEMLGIVDMRKGSGIYVVGPASVDNRAETLDIGAFELMEARRAYEVETAALAAERITEDHFELLEQLLEQMQSKDELAGEDADREFHLTIARATGNGAMVSIVGELWVMRERCDLARTILERARGSGLAPRIAEHRLIVEALRSRDPTAAREAMRAHLNAVIEHLLARTESQFIERARIRTADLRGRLFGPNRGEASIGA